MSTIHICDVCKKETVKELIFEIMVMDGEHPHCGQTMHKHLDCCFECLKKFNKKHTIEIDEELVNLMHLIAF